MWLTICFGQSWFIFGDGSLVALWWGCTSSWRVPVSMSGFLGLRGDCQSTVGENQVKLRWYYIQGEPPSRVVHGLMGPLNKWLYPWVTGVMNGWDDTVDGKLPANQLRWLMSRVLRGFFSSQVVQDFWNINSIIHSKNHPTYPWNIPRTPNQHLMKEFPFIWDIQTHRIYKPSKYTWICWRRFFFTDYTMVNQH